MVFYRVGFEGFENDEIIVILVCIFFFFKRVCLGEGREMNIGVLKV